MKPLVAIRCIVYNQEVYIRDALDSFIMQETDFPYVAIVHDDASTDGTADIIREYAEKYPDIIKPIFETENQYSKPGNPLGEIMRRAIDNTGAKYVAYCEGDDYWTDPLKLQKQVDFLEANPDYGMCYARVKRYIQAKSKYKDIWGGPNVTFETLLQENTVPTPTVMLRTDLLMCYINDINPQTKDWMMGDYPMWLYFAVTSKIKILEEQLATYRIIDNSASHSKNITKHYKMCLNYREIALHFIKKYRTEVSEMVVEEVECDVVWYTILYKCLCREKVINTYFSEKGSIMDRFKGKRKLITHLMRYPWLLRFMLILNRQKF